MWTAFYLKKSVKEREKKREKKEKRKEGKIPPGYNTIPIVMNRMFINTSLSIGGEVLAFAVQ